MRVSRRRFLVGAAATGALGPGLLIGCGGTAADDDASGPTLVSLFSPDGVIAAGMAQRIPFAVVDIGELELADDVEVEVRVLADGEEVDVTTVVGRVVDHDHVGAQADDPDHQHADLLRYFALRTVLPEPGIYDLEVAFGAAGTGRLPVQAFDPAGITVPLSGRPLPSISTPTTGAPAGITPLCTRAPAPCPFHELDVAELVGAGRPVAILVATPALCSTAYCGPVVDTLIDAVDEAGAAYRDLGVVHLEVYANAGEVSGGYDDPALRIAEPVSRLGLTFEPSLILVDRGGVVVDRIDNVFDRAELDEALIGLAEL